MKLEYNEKEYINNEKNKQNFSENEQKLEITAF